MLVTGAQSALVPIGILASGAGTSLSGADNLIAWANGAAAAAREGADKEKPHPPGSGSSSGASTSSSGGGSSTSSAGGSSTPASTDCGGGIIAGPNTSCPFALNVHAAWQAAPGVNNTVQAYSPVTGQTYTMTCAQAGAGITCSGGNNASVSW
jgi:hypothetical protein